MSVLARLAAGGVDQIKQRSDAQHQLILMCDVGRVNHPDLDSASGECDEGHHIHFFSCLSTDEPIAKDRRTALSRSLSDPRDAPERRACQLAKLRVSSFEGNDALTVELVQGGVDVIGIETNRIP